MVALEEGRVGLLVYTLRNEAGEVLDQNDSSDPLPYLHGAQNIVPGLEDALAGAEVGDRLSVEVPPEKGYGPHDGSPLVEVPRDQFPPGQEIMPGMHFFAQGPDGHVVIWVKEVEADLVRVDQNHPLAGVALSFEVEVVGIRDSSDDEKAHGHPHGPDGTSGHHH